MRIASWRDSTLAIDDRRLGSVDAVRVLAPGVGVRVVEGVDRASGRDLDLKPVAGCEVADGKLHSTVFWVPKQPNFVRPTQSLGQFSSRLADALARRRRTDLPGCSSGGPPGTLHATIFDHA